MRLLLDTHIVLWRMTANARLSRRAAQLMDDSTNSVFVSVVSIWEVAIKFSLARKGIGRMRLSGGDFLREIRKVGLDPLAIAGEHAAALDDLPAHHADPFDRLLLAQARSESMHLLTHDSKLAAYGEFVLKV